MDDAERSKRLWGWAFGNGERGADERLVAVEEKLRTLEESLEKRTHSLEETLRKLQEAEEKRSTGELVATRERRAFFIGIGAVLFALGLGGIQFALWLTDRVDAIYKSIGLFTPGF